MKKLIAISLAFVVLLGGATVLYRLLGQTVSPNQLQVNTKQPDSISNPPEPSASSTQPHPSTTAPSAPDTTSPATQPPATENTPSPTQPQPTETTQPSESTQPSEPTQPQPTETTQAPTEAPIQPVPTAPDFTVYDADGNPVHLSDFFGKPIVLNFWASWCYPCRMEMPDFNEKYLALGSEIQFLMINITDGYRETVESASKFIRSQGYSFPVFFDTHGDAATVYGVNAYPTTYFIDANGQLTAWQIGALDAATLQQGIDMIS